MAAAPGLALADAAGGHARWPLAVRARLAWEILRAYAPAYRRLRANDLAAMARHARAAAADVPLDAGCDRVALATRLGHAVTRTLAPLPTDTRCLARSLVLLRILRRRGIAAELVIGVRSSGGFAAHAWLECDGVPVLPVGAFEPITRL